MLKKSIKELVEWMYNTTAGSDDIKVSHGAGYKNNGGVKGYYKEDRIEIIEKTDRLG